MATATQSAVPTATLLLGHHPGKCPGVIRGNIRVKIKKGEYEMRPGLIYCSHEDHEGQTFDRCLDCGERTELSDGLTCRDHEGCAETMKVRLEANPLHKMLKECWEAGEQERARKAAEKAARAPAIPDDAPVQGKGTGRPRKAKDSLGGRCHLTGETTKGGRFKPGNDAKLKGILQRAGIDGDVEAIVEVLHRGWMKRPQLYETAKYELAEQTFEQYTEIELNDWLKARLEARWALIEQGTEPEQAVREGRASDGG